MTPDTAPS